MHKLIERGDKPSQREFDEMSRAYLPLMHHICNRYSDVDDHDDLLSNAQWVLWEMVASEEFENFVFGSDDFTRMFSKCCYMMFNNMVEKQNVRGRYMQVISADVPAGESEEGSYDWFGSQKITPEDDLVAVDLYKKLNAQLDERDRVLLAVLVAPPEDFHKAIQGMDYERTPRNWSQHLLSRYLGWNESEVRARWDSIKEKMKNLLGDNNCLGFSLDSGGVLNV